MSGTPIVPPTVDSRKNYNKIIAWLTGILTLLLALFSFILSFNALTDLAARHQFSIPFLFPLVVEAGVVIFSINALYRSIHDEKTMWQWVLIIGSSLLAGGFNILHAQEDLISQVMAAMPSLFLLLSFETFIGQIKHAVKRSDLIKTIEQLTMELNQLDTLKHSQQSELDRLNIEAVTLNHSIEQSRATLMQLEEEFKQFQCVQDSSIEHAKDVKAQRDAAMIERRRSELINILVVDGDIGPSAMAERLHSSRGTVYSDLKALSKTGRIIKNGAGWEVVQ